jgi:hypothetical protein
VKTTTEILEINLSGKEIYPETLKASEIAEIISAYEISLLSIVQRDHPEINIDEAFISLVEVTKNSAHFKFQPRIKKVFINAAIVVNTSLSTGNYYSLPFKSIESLQTIWHFTKRNNCVAQFAGDKSIPVAQISPESKIEIDDSFYYQGETTIYGMIERIGGSIPRVRMKLDDDTILYTEIDKVKAKELALKLYDTVCVKGFAKWRKDNYKLEDFKIEEIVGYSETSVSDSLSALKNSIGSYWDKISNPDEYIMELRYSYQG